MIKQKKQKITLYTLGHSTRSIDEFIEVLNHYGINHIIDIRRMPRSRYNPQFNQEQLRQSLNAASIKYTHMKDLYGFRPTNAQSVNTGWRNKSFRGFADYMQTALFQEGIEKLIEYACHDQVAILCAEAVPWRCHRSLIGDALVIRGIDVEDIISLTSSRPHKLTPWAHVEGTNITYPDLNMAKE